MLNYENEMPVNVSVSGNNVIVKFHLTFIYETEILDYVDNYDIEVPPHALIMHDGGDDYGDIEHINDMNNNNASANRSPCCLRNGCHAESDIIDDNDDILNITHIIFPTFDTMMNYAKTVESIKRKPKTSVYKFDKHYYLVFDFNNIPDDICRLYAYFAVEQTCDLCFQSSKTAFIKEHGNRIIKKDALQTLCEL